MSPKKENKENTEERKSQILEAATKVFARSGFNKARMDDIVEESGLSKGTLYWYFDSKDDIIIAILKRVLGYEFRKLELIRDSDASARQRLEEFVAFMVKDIDRLMPIMPLFYDFFALGLRQKKVRLVLGELLKMMNDTMAPIIREGIENGEFREVDVEEATLAVGAMLEGTMVVWTYDPDTVDVLKQLKAGMNMLLQGLLLRPDEESN